MCMGVCPERQEKPDPPELMSQMAVSHLMWVLGTKPGSSERDGHALNN